MSSSSSRRALEPEPCFRVIRASPISPSVENVTPSFVIVILTLSPTFDKSRQMRANSLEDNFTTASYSVSGIPKCSVSMSISLRSNSPMRSELEPSKTRCRLSALSALRMFKISLLLALRKTLLRLAMAMPMLIGRSQRYSSKPSARSSTAERATCELSIACRRCEMS